MNKTPVDDFAYRPCVGMMLVNTKGHVFVADRSDIKESAWQMPQGGIDEGETAQAAAWRELAEEVGTDRAELVAESKAWLTYDFPADQIKKAWKGRYRGQRQKWFLFKFTGTDDDIDLDAHNREFDKWKWVEPKTLPDLIVPFKRALYENVLIEFSEPLSQLNSSNAN